MRIVFCFVGLLIATQVSAEPTAISIPQEKLVVRLDSPALTKLQENYENGRYSYMGNAGKFNISIFLGPSTCESGDSKEGLKKCFLDKLNSVPFVLMNTVRANEIAEGVLVSYQMEVQSASEPVRVVHSHILFSHAGKAGDVHGSMVATERTDILRLFAVMQSVKLEPIMP